MSDGAAFPLENMEVLKRNLEAVNSENQVLEVCVLHLLFQILLSSNFSSLAENAPIAFASCSYFKIEVGESGTSRVEGARKLQHFC